MDQNNQMSKFWSLWFISEAELWWLWCDNKQGAADKNSSTDLNLFELFLDSFFSVSASVALFALHAASITRRHILYRTQETAGNRYIELSTASLCLSSVSPSSTDLLGRQRRSELADLLLDRTGCHSGQEGRLGHPRRQPEEFPGSRVQDDSGGDGRRERGVQRRTFRDSCVRRAAF